MQQEKIELNELTLVGLSIRTNNSNERDPKKSKISVLANHYWAHHLSQNIAHRQNPGVTYSAYTAYESDEYGDYTYFIGEAVNSLDNQPFPEFNSLIIPRSAYQKFTTPMGAMPDIIIQAWQIIWQMPLTDLGGKRQYITDFEVYDERARNPQKAIADIYIGIHSSKT